MLIKPSCSCVIEWKSCQQEPHLTAVWSSGNPVNRNRISRLCDRVEILSTGTSSHGCVIEWKSCQQEPHLSAVQSSEILFIKLFNDFAFQRESLQLQVLLWCGGTRSRHSAFVRLKMSGLPFVISEQVRDGLQETWSITAEIRNKMRIGVLLLVTWYLMSRQPWRPYQDERWDSKSQVIVGITPRDMTLCVGRGLEKMKVS